MSLWKVLSRRGKWIFSLTCILFMIQETFYLFVLYRMGKIVDLAAAGDSGMLAHYAFVSALCVLGMYGLHLGTQAVRSALLHNGMVHLSDLTMKNLLLRFLPGFRAKEDAYYLNLFGTDMDIFCNSYLDSIPPLCGSLISLAQTVVLLLYIHPMFLVFAVCMVGLPLMANGLFSSQIQSFRMRYSDASRQFTGILRETVEGYEDIRLDHGEEAVHRRFSGAAAERMKRYAFYGTVSGAVSWGTSGISTAMGILGIVFGAFLYARGELTVGLLLVATNYISSTAERMGSILQYVTAIRSTGKIRERLREEYSAPCQEEAFEPLTGRPEIAYENVSFSFGEKQLYDKLCLQLQPGKCVAIVGESGSGKSTLIKLLLKYYEDYTGTIMLAGQDIRSLSEQQVYSLVGVIPQSPYLFNASLYDNITMFSKTPEQGSAAYRELLKELNLVALAARVGEEPLGDFGDGISGGERQRISIARSFRRHPAVMIFDEPCAGLDPENAAMIREFIFSHNGMTRIVITHDWSAEFLGRFDEVVTLGEAAPRFCGSQRGGA